jgi:hypothetical protein
MLNYFQLLYHIFHQFNFFHPTVFLAILAYFTLGYFILFLAIVNYFILDHL